MAVSFERVAPIFRMFDVAKAKEFYIDYLGFSIDWEHRFEETAPLYMQISRGSLVLHLSEHYGDACPGSTVYVDMTGVEEFHREISTKNYRYLRPGIGETPWQTRCVNLIDPFGNRLRLNERVGKLEGEH